LKPQALFGAANKREQNEDTGEAVPELSRTTRATFIGRSPAALAIVAGLAGPAGASDLDRTVAAFECSMIAKFATTEADSLRLFEIGKRAGVRQFQKQDDLYVDLPREQAIYFSLGSWWAARTSHASIELFNQGKAEFGEGFQLNSPEGIKLMKEQYRLRNCSLISEAGGGPDRPSTGELMQARLS
jgi:hypothetical protein